MGISAQLLDYAEHEGRVTGPEVPGEDVTHPRRNSRETVTFGLAPRVDLLSFGISLLLMHALPEIAHAQGTKSRCWIKVASESITGMWDGPRRRKRRDDVARRTCGYMTAVF